MDSWLLDGELSEALRPVFVAERVCFASGGCTEAGEVGFRTLGEGGDFDTTSGWCSFCSAFSPGALSPSAGEKRKCNHILDVKA